ncbi:MAG: MMPL family transporter [Candidatus Krumholzibacteriota bacterium]|nr:MMPL family transporter [Candidatus Krumholzibacteriota bacterium]
MTPEQTERYRTARYTRWVIRWRYPIILLSIVATLAVGSGARKLGFDTDYRAFFSKENPQLIAFEAIQNIYTKNDNIMFIVTPSGGDVFTAEALTAVEALTEEAWKLPFAIRVDAVTNFQNTLALDDDLFVADLVEGAGDLSAAELDAAREIALGEPLLVNRTVSDRAHVTGVNVTLQLPGKKLDEVPFVVGYARELSRRITEQHPGIEIRLSGMTMLNNAFSEAGIRDMQTLIPVMYIGRFLVMLLLLRSLGGALATMIVVAFSTVVALGLAGWAGIKLTPPSATAPTMIMTLAIADSIHILVTMLYEMRRGLDKRDALVESMRINMQPVFLTSLTTAIGFLSMNFSDAPPFRDLGNITAMGVAAAFGFSVFLLPALIAVLPMRVRAREESGKMSPVDRLGGFVVARRRPLLWGSVAVVMLLAVFIPANDLNDEFVKYFDERIAFRVDSDYMMENLTGVYQVEFNVTGEDANGVAEPEYLETLERFAAWYRTQPNVVHVNTFSDVMKRLNKNLHGDDPAMYRVPDSRELAAQYLLLYELSLPFGLDLNNQVNLDKSATRFIVTLGSVSSREIRRAGSAGEEWLRSNAPEYMHANAAGTAFMFAHISERNIRSMLTGTTIALIIISLSLIFALRSIRYGLLSLVPNLVPAVLAFGLWGIIVGQVGVALSVVTGMTLGIVVDDTVHFLSKYLRARREKGLNAEEAVRYAFRSVGVALVVTSVILIAGFLVLSQSAFELNSGMGQLTAIAIAFALLADFLLLPPLLIAMDRRRNHVAANIEEEHHETALGHS